MNKWAVRHFTMHHRRQKPFPIRPVGLSRRFSRKTDEQWAVQRLTMHHRRQKARLMRSIGLNRHFIHTSRPSRGRRVGDSHAIRFASYRLRFALCMCGTHDLGGFFGGAMSRARRLFGRGLSVECRPLRRQVWLSPYRRRSGSIAYRRFFFAERRPRCQAAAPTLTSAAKKHALVIATCFILVLSFSFSSIMRRSFVPTSGSSLYFPGLSARDCCCSVLRYWR